MEKECKCCAVKFVTDQSSAKYCSPGCYNIGRRVPKEKPCAACGAVFSSQRVKRAKYCGVACAAIAKTKREVADCAHCKKSFLPANANVRHCSKACAYIQRRGRPVEARKTGESKKCTHCGHAIYVQRILVKDKNFCGKECHDAHQSRAKVDRVCTVCATPFRLSPSTAARTAGRYCSMACRSACPVWRLNAAVRANLKQMNAKGPNRLEIAGRAILDAIGVPYREQVLIEDRFVVDVQLDGLPVVIQWDGAYWHGYRAPGDDRPLDARQAKRATFDRSQDAFMRSRGLTVLRFWEHDVQQSPAMVEATIRSALPSQS